VFPLSYRKKYFYLMNAVSPHPQTPTDLVQDRQLTSDSVICGGRFLNSSTNDGIDIIPQPPRALQLRPPRRPTRLPARVPRGNRRVSLQSPLCAYFGRGRFLGREYPVRVARGRNGNANDPQSVGQFKRMCVSSLCIFVFFLGRTKG